MGKFNFSGNEFTKIKDGAETFYPTIGSVKCPYFGNDIVFNTKGFKHLKFKSDQQARLQKDQYPNWNIDKNNKKRVLYSGNPEYD